MISRFHFLATRFFETRLFRGFSLLLCSLIPLAFLVFALEIRHSPASTMMRRDPVYYYLLNSYSLALGDWAHYIAHPGAPLQIFGGWMVWIKSIFFPESDLPRQAELLRSHFQYARFLGTSLIVVNFLSVIIATIFLWRNKVPLLCILLAQVLICFMPLSIPFIGLFQPESLFVTAASLLLIVLSLARSSLNSPKSNWSLPLFVGGFLALKFNFAPYLLLNLLFQQPKARMQAFLRSLGFALALCLVVVVEWNYLLSVHLKSILAQGRYDQGGWGLVDVPWIREQLRNSDLALEAAFTALALIAGLVSVSYWQKKKEEAKEFYLVLAVFFLCLLLYLKKPTHTYYLLPALAVLPSVTVLFYSLLSGWKRWLFILACVPLLVLQGQRVNFTVNYQRGIIALADADTKRLAQIVEENKSCSQLVLGPVPLESEALQVGSDWASKRWAGVLEKEFSNTFFINASFQIRDWNHITKEEGAWLKQQKAPCVLSVLFVPSIIDRKQENPAREKIKFLKASKLLDCQTLYCAYRYDLKR